MLSQFLDRNAKWRCGLLSVAAMLAILGSGAAFGQTGQFPVQQSGVPNPICQRLEAQLAAIDRAGGGGDGGRAEQVRRYEEAANRQQNELDRMRSQAERNGCNSGGFFSIFSQQPPQCSGINAQIRSMQSNLDRMMSDLQRMHGPEAGNAMDGQKRSVVLALAQNNCGPQYANMARGMQSGNVLDSLFGGNSQIAPGGAPGNTFRTVCVRTCDGYYFPISFATAPDRFADDEQSCKRQCPAAEVQLYTYRNPGEDMNQAVSISGQPYTALSTAFSYRQHFNAACSCRSAGQSWADAMKGIDERSSISNGDIIVTEDRAKRLSQPVGKPAARTAPANTSAQQSDAATQTPANGQIRSVGPTFIPQTR